METYEKLRMTSEPPSWNEYGVPGEFKKSFALAMLEFTLDDGHGFWEAPDSKNGHCSPDQYVVDVASRLHEASVAYNGKTTQSPIEDMMLGGLVWMRLDWAFLPRVDPFQGPHEHKDFGPAQGLEYWITPQAKISGYSVDFLVWFRLKNIVAGVAIECDGHAFHEKTKEQAASDKKRDRAIVTAGFPVLRFTGSEIFRDTLGCVGQVKNTLFDPLMKVSKEGGLF